MRKRTEPEQAVVSGVPDESERPSRSATYGVEAEIERLMRCPECGSNRVRAARQSTRGYGVFGFKAVGDLRADKPMHCHNCGHEWLRPPMRELRREAERRVDERYAALSSENERLRKQLHDYVAYQRDIDRMIVAPPEEPDFGPDVGVPFSGPLDN